MVDTIYYLKNKTGLMVKFKAEGSLLGPLFYTTEERANHHLSLYKANDLDLQIGTLTPAEVDDLWVSRFGDSDLVSVDTVKIPITDRGAQIEGQPWKSAFSDGRGAHATRSALEECLGIELSPPMDVVTLQWVKDNISVNAYPDDAGSVAHPEGGWEGYSTFMVRTEGLSAHWGFEVALPFCEPWAIPSSSDFVHKALVKLWPQKDTPLTACVVMSNGGFDIEVGLTPFDAKTWNLDPTRIWRAGQAPRKEIKLLN